jgi:two-component system chemotaxis sensor kinase CheA
MGFDLSEFLDMLYEEVEEHVKTLERIFLSMHVNARVDNESINEAFRAAHSIKGGAATFDMADISSLSHALESVLDKMRHGHVSLDASLVNLFMKTLDEIRYLLSSRMGNEPSDARASARLVEDLNAVMSLQPPEKKRIRVEDLAIEGKDYGFFKKEIPSVAPLEEMADSDERKTRQVLLESNSIRVSVQKVDELVDLVGEFIITQSMLEEAARAIESEKSENLMRFLGAMKKRSSELQNAVL